MEEQDDEGTGGSCTDGRRGKGGAAGAAARTAGLERKRGSNHSTLWFDGFRSTEPNQLRGSEEGPNRVVFYGPVRQTAGPNRTTPIRISGGGGPRFGLPRRMAAYLAWLPSLLTVGTCHPFLTALLDTI